MNKKIAERQGRDRLPAVGSWTKVSLALAGLGLIGLVGLLGGCSSQGPTYAEGSSDSKLGNPDQIPDAIPRVEPKSKYGNMDTYVVKGRRYYTKDSSKGHVERGLASWYGPYFHRRKTSSGERYDMYAMTAAHKTLPLPTYARVTNIENGRSAVVKINDRGPFHGPRVIDLSYAAATKLGVVRKGTAMVEIRAIDPARPDSDPGPFLAAKSAGAPTSMLARNEPRSPSSILGDDEPRFPSIHVRRGRVLVAYAHIGWQSGTFARVPGGRRRLAGRHADCRGVDSELCGPRRVVRCGTRACARRSDRDPRAGLRDGPGCDGRNALSRGGIGTDGRGQAQRPLCTEFLRPDREGFRPDSGGRGRAQRPVCIELLRPDPEGFRAHSGGQG